jgi:hypothetical protein
LALKASNKVFVAVATPLISGGKASENKAILIIFPP